jgi:predicted nucleic acid-binding Zn ribbon protein
MMPPAGPTPPPANHSADDDGTADLPAPPQHLAAIPGMDLVRRALEEARASARGLGKEVGRGRSSPERHRSTAPGGRRRWSGPGPDSRDPQPVGPAARELSSANGWSPKVAEGMVFARWDGVVGEQIAEHAQPIALRDGVLSIAAESTAWATQLRRRRGGHRPQNQRPNGPVVAQRSPPYLRPGPARHVRLSPPTTTAPAPPERRGSAPQASGGIFARDIPCTAQLGVQKRRYRIGPVRP